jgi:hypothetical protein
MMAYRLGDKKEKAKRKLLGGELNPGLPRTIDNDRRKY